MKNIALKMAVLGTLGFSSQVFALGLEPLVAAPTGSAYLTCYSQGQVDTTNALGNFGSADQSISLPTATLRNKCAIVGLASELAAPKTGYASVTSATRVVPKSDGTGSIGSFVDTVWRKPAATAPATATDMCIISSKFTGTNTDWDTVTAGTQVFEVNDIARGGYSASGTVNVGYFILSSTSSPVYRVGRSFTSVQHRAKAYDTGPNKAIVGSGYLQLPTIGGTSTTYFNGESTGIAAGTIASTTADKQTAAVNSNFVDFTIDAGAVDDDGGVKASSATTYIEFPCNSDSAATINSTWVKTGAIRLRRTAQENTTPAQISISGYAPPGATITEP